MRARRCVDSGDCFFCQCCCGGRRHRRRGSNSRRTESCRGSRCSSKRNRIHRRRSCRRCRRFKFQNNIRSHQQVWCEGKELQHRPTVASAILKRLRCSSPPLCMKALRVSRKPRTHLGTVGRLGSVEFSSYDRNMAFLPPPRTPSSHVPR